MNLTREQAVAEFRKQWRWIAEKTLERKCIVEKDEYFEEQDIKSEDIPKNMCYLCDYSLRRSYIACSQCPIPRDLSSPFQDCCNGLYRLWLSESDYIKSADLAAQIAELPEVEA